jgi:hypothetical protein
MTQSCRDLQHAARHTDAPKAAGTTQGKKRLKSGNSKACPRERTKAGPARSNVEDGPGSSHGTFGVQGRSPWGPP